MKICGKCKKEKELNNFNKNSRKEDGLQDYCKSCKKGADDKYYKKDPKFFNKRNKEYCSKKLELIKELLLNRKCEKCNDKRWWVIDYHHINPKIKDFNVSSGLSAYKIETIKNEMAKCKTLCATCHRDFHFLEKNMNITIEEYLNNDSVS